VGILEMQTGVICPVAAALIKWISGYQSMSSMKD